MESVSRSWAGVSERPGTVDERDRAAFGELAMARSPMRRVGWPDPPDADGAPDSSAAVRRDGVPRGGRPGKRW